MCCSVLHVYCSGRGMRDMSMTPSRESSLESTNGATKIDVDKSTIPRSHSSYCTCPSSFFVSSSSLAPSFSLHVLILCNCRMSASPKQSTRRPIAHRPTNPLPIMVLMSHFIVPFPSSGEWVAGREARGDSAMHSPREFVTKKTAVAACVAIRCNSLQCVAACCSVLQCVAVCCSVLCNTRLFLRQIGPVIYFISS